MPYDKIDRDILKFMQGDLPLRSRPYQDMARRIGLSEEELISRVSAMMDRGLIRRVGAILRHQQVGFTVNAMVAWKVDAIQADGAGQMMAEFVQISHCYLRQVPPEFEYNLFSMIHAHSQEELDQIIEEISNRTGLKEYNAFKSIKEFKKVSMQYF